MYRWWKYVWAAPTTAIGLMVVGVARVSGGRSAIVDGVLDGQLEVVAVLLDATQHRILHRRARRCGG